MIRVSGVVWFTNIDIKKRHEELVMYKTYNPEEFPKYENYEAINVDKSTDIPMDYDGVIGVPITFLDKYSPDQFEIVGLGIVGSCEFTNERRMEILDKNGIPTGKYTVNAKGTLYRKHLESDKKPAAFKDCETGELYQSIYTRILIKKEEIMKITLHTIKVRDLVNGYADNDENGVVGYGGKLDIRPPYQREFCYNDNQQQAVMDTVTKNFPLNTMYWVVREDGRYEVLDGQQRTISICRYVNGNFSHNMRYFTNLQPDEKEQILNYDLQVYFCEGSESEKLSCSKQSTLLEKNLQSRKFEMLFTQELGRRRQKRFSQNQTVRQNCFRINM